MTLSVKYILHDRVEWRFDSRLHRKNGPAVIWHNGATEWFIHGMAHREDGPAVEYTNGRKEYWFNDKYYSEKAYYKTIIKRRKLNGEPLTYPNGSKFWCNVGMLHNIDGPAIIWPDGSIEYYLEDVAFSEEEWLRLVVKSWR